MTSSKNSELVFVGSKTFSRSGTTSDFDVILTDLAGGTDTAPLEGDIVIVTQGIAGGNPKIFNPPSGWTEITRIVATDSEDAHLTSYYKVMGVIPDTLFTILGTQHVEDPCGVIVRR